MDLIVKKVVDESPYFYAWDYYSKNRDKYPQFDNDKSRFTFQNFLALEAILETIKYHEDLDILYELYKARRLSIDLPYDSDTTLFVLIEIHEEGPENDHQWVVRFYGDEEAEDAIDFSVGNYTTVEFFNAYRPDEEDEYSDYIEIIDALKEINHKIKNFRTWGEDA